LPRRRRPEDAVESEACYRHGTETRQRAPAAPPFRLYLSGGGADCRRPI